MQSVQAQRKPNAGLEYPYLEAPAGGTVAQVAPGVYWLRMPLPFALDHINLWLLADGAGWTIVDCGFAGDQARVYWEQIFACCLGGKPVTRVIVTHYHPDHIGLCHWLCEKFDLMPWMTQTEFLQAHAVHSRTAGTDRAALRDLLTRHGLEAPRTQWIAAPENIYERGVPALPVTFRCIADGDTLAIGDHDWRVMVGRGHAPEHAALHCERLRVLISGDMLLPRISTNVSVWPTQPEADPVGEFLDSIADFAQLHARTLVLPSHGLPFYGARARVAALHAHHRTRLEKLHQACAVPRSAAESLPVLFDRQFDDHHLMFAMGEAIAHLNYLMHRGMLQRITDAGIYRFVKTDRAFS